MHRFVDNCRTSLHARSCGSTASFSQLLFRAALIGRVGLGENAIGSRLWLFERTSLHCICPPSPSKTATKLARLPYA